MLQAKPTVNGLSYLLLVGLFEVVKSPNVIRLSHYLCRCSRPHKCLKHALNVVVLFHVTTCAAVRVGHNLHQHHT